MTFHVGWVDDREAGFRALVLRDEGLDESLEVQRGDADADGPGSRDADLCCLVRNGAAVAYGGVESLALVDARLVVTLTPEAADVLALPVVVTYDLGDGGCGLVRRRLRELVPDLVREGF